MKAKLKSLDSSDIDLDTFWPSEPGNFGFFLQAMIGPDDEDGAESFGIQVCTPEWLASRHASGTLPDVVLGTHMMIVFSYDLSHISRFLERYCERCVGKDWATLAVKLSKLGAWEFEDYH